MKKHYTFICAKCGKEYTLELTDSEYKNKKYKKHCSRACANSRVMTKAVKLKIAQTVNQLMKESPELFLTTPYKTYTCKYCGKMFKNKDKRDTTSRIYCSESCKQQWLKENWKPKIGGYRKGSGRGKSGWYKGIYCDSSWELAFVIYYIDHELNIIRCKDKRSYEYRGKKCVYIPDFITDDGVIEIKGYKTKQWEAKEKFNPDIKVLYEQDMKFYLNYVIKKYGNDYIKLYDNSNPKLNEDIYLRKFVWVSNPITKQRTMIQPEKFEAYISNGWIKGRVNF